MISLVLFDAAEATISRPDLQSLSTQSFMELLVENLPDKRHFQDYNGDFLKVIKWHGLKLVSNDEIESIAWGNRFAEGGSIDLKWIPPSTKTFDAWQNKLIGTADFTILPVNFVMLNLSCNELDGTINLTQLPGTLRDLYLYNNKFSGTLDLTALPFSMKCLSLYTNSFTGAVNLTAIPIQMWCIYLEDNELSGTVLVSNLPSGLNEVRFPSNKIEAVVDKNGEPCVDHRVCIDGEMFTTCRGYWV